MAQPTHLVLTEPKGEREITSRTTLLVFITGIFVVLALVIFIWPPVLILAVLISPCVVSWLAAQYPHSFLAKVATFLAVISGLMVGVTALIFVAERFDTLSFRNQSILFLLALYAGSFAVFEAIAREQRIKHFRRGELAAADWTRRFRKITENTAPDVLSLLHRDGVALRNEFGNLTHPDFKRNMEMLATQIQHNSPADE